MVPFVVIIAIMALASITISIYSLSDTMKTQTLNTLKKESHITQNNLDHIWDTMTLATEIMGQIRPLSPDMLRDKTPHSKRQAIFDWNNLKLFTHPSSLSPFQEKQYKTLLELGRLSEKQVIPHLYHHNDSFHIELVSVSSIKKKKENRPIIAEYPINTSVLDALQAHIQSNLALVYFGNLEGEKRAEILTTSPIINALPALQKQLKKHIKHNLKKQKKEFIRSAQIGTTTYTIFFKQTNLSPNLYFTIVKTSEEMLHAKIQVILVTIFVLLLISFCIFCIYALIIQKITSSIDILSSVSEKVAKGDLDQHVYLDASDEIGELSSIFNQMVVNLKESSENLQKEKERSETIISYIPEGIIVTDPENRLIVANHKAEDMFNFSLNEVQGKILLEYINNEELLTVLSEKLNTNAQVVTREVTIPGENDDETHIYSLTSSLVDDTDGEPLGVITILKDMTYEKQIEELREGFLRTVSHELRTPLTSVIGFIELVRSGINISDEQGSFLDTALNEATNLKKLIDDLLDLSQLKAGRMRTQKEYVNIKDFLNDIMTTLKPLAKGKDIELLSTFKKKDLYVMADASKLRRVVINLVSNALKFTKSGYVKVSCIETHSHMQFEVEDSGIGLREKEKEVIFEKFRQVDYSSHREYEGIGLGLSIVKKLVNMHGGEIWVESIYGEGSSFFFTIEK